MCIRDRPTPLLLDDEPEGSYHGYACGDYYRIDPRFGSNELYRELSLIHIYWCSSRV